MNNEQQYEVTFTWYVGVDATSYIGARNKAIAELAEMLENGDVVANPSDMAIAVRQVTS